MAISIPNISDKNSPSYPHPAYDECKEELKVCRDVDAGYKRIRSEAKTYLPIHPREQGDDYLIRLKRPVFFNGFTRTHQGLTGMVFRVDPVLGEDVPPRIVDIWQNIDNQGTLGDIFIKRVFDDAMIAGHSFIYVDYPQVENAAELTRADEMGMSIRPYWLHITKDQVTNWRYATENGQIKLVMAVIKEHIDEVDGSFGHKDVIQYRVLRKDGTRVTFELWEEIEGTPRVTQPEREITNVSEIPLIPVYTGQTAILESRPPLIDLAYANILHYQTSSDMHHAAHIANVPVFFGKGFSADQIEVGPNSALIIPAGGADVDAGWLETTGAGIGLTRQILQDIEGQMAVLGLNMLKREFRAAETAEAKRMDKAEQDSALASAAMNLQDAVELALGYTAEFMKLPQGGTININKDFAAEALSPQLIAEYRNMVAAGQLSLDTLWSLLEENGALPDEFDPDVEREQIDQAAVAMPFGQPQEEPPPDEEEE